MTKIISFLHLGNYYIPISYFIKKVTKCDVIIPPKITRRAIELGSKYSPDFVCVPFKYNLGNYIESIELGANSLLQAGGGCRYGYYGELQEQILKDLNYNIEFVNFIKDNHVSLKNIYKFSKQNNKKLNILFFAYYLIITIFMIIFMDKLDKYLRENIGFEINPGNFEKIEQDFFQDLNKNPHLIKLFLIYHKYKKLYKNIPLNKPNNALKVAVLGELYSIMEHNSSFHIERKLAKRGIHITRYIDLTFLLITKRFKLRKILKKGKKYLKYHLGADASESVIHSYLLAKKNYDGIIHIKSFGCTPEINAIPIMDKISNEYNIPIIHFSFDSSDYEVALDTRIEAFYDMIISKKVD